ncbi:MAG: alkaline shock response membrane anchor protein AmaP [Actinomycetota bacterium]|nr:alkaline shock response membrane anchor protein AmaP [Actinomycetota bacterium]
MSDTANRLLLGLLGLVLIAAGVIGLLAGAGLVPLLEPAEIYEELVSGFQERAYLWWPVSVAAAVVIALLGLMWALRQLIVRRPGGSLGDVVVSADDRGRTSVSAKSLASAAAADLRRVPGVVDSTVRLVNDPHRPDLRARLDVRPDADLDKVRRGADEVAERLEAVLGVDTLTSHVLLRPVPQDRSGVGRLRQSGRSRVR